MDTLLAGLSLPQGVPLRSENGAYFLVVQPDGNLVAYTSCDFRPTNAFWSSATQGKGTGPYRLALQHDGNLVLYDRFDKATWATGTHAGAQSGARDRLVLQSDRNLVLYRGPMDAVRWSSNTHV
jgi:hypothetical protein